MTEEELFKAQVKGFYRLLMILFTMFLIVGGSVAYYLGNPSAFKNSNNAYTEAPSIDDDRIENGIHVRTGLIDAEGLMTVVYNCTNCHSSKLVTQNRMTADRWNATIRWMQETQNLGDLGENQEIIVNYLVNNYPPQQKGRRATLTNIEWYELED